MDIFCLCLAEFDLLKGNTLSYVYPPERRAILSHFSQHMGDYCLPDGAHYFEEDTTLVVIPSNVTGSLKSFNLDENEETSLGNGMIGATEGDMGNNNQSTSTATGSSSSSSQQQNMLSFIEPYVDKPMYAHCLFRNKKDSRVKRGAIQKSLILFSTQPHFTVYENLLRVAINRILDLENIYLQVNATASKKQPGEELSEELLQQLNQVHEQINDILKEFYEQCTTCNMLQLKLFPTMTNDTTFTLNIPRQIDPFTPVAYTHGTSLIQLIQLFGVEVMLTCWNALLLDKRIMVIGSPAKLVSQICFTLPLLVYPFQINVNRIHPYVPLSDMDDVMAATSKIPEYIIGTTNALFETQGKNQRTQWWDVCLSVNSRKVQIAEKMPPHFSGSDLMGGASPNAGNESDSPTQIEKLNAYQKVFILNVMNEIREGKTEQWVREQFKTHNIKFITELLSKGKLLQIINNATSDVLSDPQKQASLLKTSSGQLKKIQRQFITESSKFRNYAFKQYPHFRHLHFTGMTDSPSDNTPGKNNLSLEYFDALQLLQYLQDEKIIKKQKLKYLYDLDKLLSSDANQIDLLLSVNDSSSIFTTIRNNKWLVDDNNQWRKYSASILSQLAVSVKGQIQLLSLLPYIKLLTEDAMPNVKRIGYYCIMKVSNLYIGTYAILRIHHDIIDKILDNILNESLTDANFYEIRMYSIQTLLQICYYFDYFKQSISVVMADKVDTTSSEYSSLVEDEEEYAKILGVSVDVSMVNTIMEKLDVFKRKIIDAFSYDNISNNSTTKRSLKDYKFIDKLLILYDFYEVYNNYRILTESALKYNMSVFYYLRKGDVGQTQSVPSFTEMYHHISSLVLNIKHDLKKSSSLTHQQATEDEINGSTQSQINEFHHHHISVFLLALLQSTNLVNIIFNEFILNVNHIRVYKNYKLLYMVMQLLYYVIDTNIGMYYLLISNYIEYCLTFIKYFSVVNVRDGETDVSDSNLNFRLFKCYTFIMFVKRLCKYRKAAYRLIESNALQILGQFIITHYHNPLLSNLTFAVIDVFQELCVFYFKHYSKEGQHPLTAYIIEEEDENENDQEDTEQFFKNPLYERNSSLFFKKRIKDRLEMLPSLRKRCLPPSMGTTTQDHLEKQQYQYQSILESSNFNYHYGNFTESSATAVTDYSSPRSNSSRLENSNNFTQLKKRPKRTRKTVFSK
ncbi:hypothetical protein C9374_002600 [Naegleria lovaniensis]|uniref:UDENN domain-containing protein n=1 Tax=Naegleria lovaniensis TaxID=51637 RepID=A0AA88KLT8_NAELO|nr:uncharacterized protein C9374_002600 [Naegleria lovaniensis]KAG2386154.1 hypothetical protein C9374_002600 [Naegleria lovaniensis]